MKAIIVTEIGGPEVMRMADVNMPRMNSKQVLIRVKKTSVNFAYIKSRYGKKGSTKLPFIPGIDVAGIIEEVGKEVKNLKVGQRVIAFPSAGSYAEYTVADENLTFVLPDNIDFDVAAACPIVSFLSHKLLNDVARIEVGETVLIHAAAGGVGTTAIQFAKLLGAGTVIGTIGNDRKAEVVLEAGADHVINYSKEDFSEKVNELTNGEGANVILDSIAGKITGKSFECLAPYGRLVQFGNSSGEVGHIKTTDLHSSCRSVLGFSFGTTRKLRPHLLHNTAEKVFQFLEEGSLKIKISEQFDLEDAIKAHKLIESRQNIGKILLVV